MPATLCLPRAAKKLSATNPCGLAQNKTCVLARAKFFNLDLFIKELADSKQFG